MKSISSLVVILLSLLLSQQIATSESSKRDRLTVHEWGTFTVLQDEVGRSIRGVNINEESLPPFVHRLAAGLAPETPELGPLLDSNPYDGSRGRSKGVPRFYPAVTMRMETPIIYFYPPEGGGGPLELDVEVQFRSGWISEWFPQADNVAPGFGEGDVAVGPLTPDTVGRITWKGLQVGTTEGQPPQTSEHVWLAPRQTRAVTVRSSVGESEHYLFYRGVANMEAPLQVVRNSDGQQLALCSNGRCPTLRKTDLPIRYLWLANIRSDGTAAFREIDPIILSANAKKPLTTIPAVFTAESHARENLGKLRASMRHAVIASGLYTDEADALLNTWEASYFKGAGLRLFFVLPRTWVDTVLPLSLSRSADVERVMIGRIELVSPEQRELLNRISVGLPSDRRWFTQPLSKLNEQERAKAHRELRAGDRSLADYGITMPDDYRSYLALGRFRDALLLDAQNRSGNANLTAFTQTYGLQYFRP